MNAAWDGLNRTWRERMEKLEEAMTASVQYQDALQVGSTAQIQYRCTYVVKDVHIQKTLFVCNGQFVGHDVRLKEQKVRNVLQFIIKMT